MKKHFLMMALIISISVLSSCVKEEKKPFGAEVIDYDKVEGVNKEGPIIESQHFENTPPMSNKTTIIESGPPHIDYSNIKIEPTADLENDPDYGGIPIVIKGNGSNGS